MTTKNKIQIEPAKGKLGVLIPGIGGAVATTFIAGIFCIIKNIAQPIGSLTQLGRIRIGKETKNRLPLIKELLPLAELTDLVFFGWDIYNDNLYEAAKKVNVLEKEHINQVKDELKSIKLEKAIFDNKFVKNIRGKNIKTVENKMQQAEELIKDIVNFKKDNKIDRCVMIWCGSTEIYMEQDKVHQTLQSFEQGLKKNHPKISPSMIYAYAALQSGIPFANGSPNLTVDIPALIELANKKKVPIAGKDFKTGQTMIKTVIGPTLKARLLGLHGWFSTNILGNRDGEVLADRRSFKTKEKSKLGVLEYLLDSNLYPQLYSNYVHKINIDYYPPKGDRKEAWDNIDIFGWLGYPMEIKINFLCRDSILAAPVVLDLVLFLDLAQRRKMFGVQEWLSFYFKTPMCKENSYPEHNLFIQLAKLKNTLRYIAGEKLPTTHLELSCYDY